MFDKFCRIDAEYRTIAKPIPPKMELSDKIRAFTNWITAEDILNEQRFYCGKLCEGDSCFQVKGKPADDYETAEVSLVAIPSGEVIAEIVNDCVMIYTSRVVRDWFDDQDCEV